LIRQMRGGQLYQSAYGTRMRGSGPYAEGIAQAFKMFCHKLDLDAPSEELDTSQFRPPQLLRGQLRLF
jgi:hypothetical protein